MGEKATNGSTAKPSTVRILTVGLVLVVLAVAIGAETGSPADAAHLPRLADIRPAPAASARLSVRGWLTTPDQSHLAQALAPSSFTESPAPGAIDLSVDPTTRFQRIIGFGAALTDASALELDSLPSGERQATLRSLFEPGDGAGINVVRVVMGTSDFAPAPYTYDDVASGQTDPSLAHFSIQHDESDILPILRAALAINPHLVILATPWSAPAWMKTSSSLDGGTLDPLDDGVYAQYFVRFIKAYSSEGVPISAITPQNEPENSASGYPSMTLSPAQESTFVAGYLGPALTAAGLSSVQIIGYDHNWSDTSYPISLLLGPAARYLSGTAFHCYSGSPSAQTVVHDAAPSKAIWFTECSGGSWSPDFATNLGWDSSKLLMGALRNWAETVLFWNVALDPYGGPHDGGCSNCRAVLTVNGDTVSRNVEFDELAELSSAVDPGAVRVASSPAVDGVKSVAFVNTDGSRAIVLDNTWGAARTVTVSDGTGSPFTTTVPGGATLSLRWTD